MGINVNLEEKITNRVTKFNAPDGKTYNSPDEYFGNKMESNVGGSVGNTPTSNSSTPRRIK